MFTNNIAAVHLGIFAVSRNNFLPLLSLDALEQVKRVLKLEDDVIIYFGKTLIDSENAVKRALAEAEKNHCNAAVILLGNFGAEGPETIFAKKFNGPVMYAGIAEDAQTSLYNGRRDTYCGMLNCSYNLNLRNCHAYIPPKPIGTAEEVAEMVEIFIPIARSVLSLRQLKIIVFGSRPNDFFACNAPILGLYNMGIEIEDNSEMDLFLAYQAHEYDSRIAEVVTSMERELGHPKYPDLLPKMAQYELTLLDWAQEHKGICEYVAFANKCWPAFREVFHFLPCYVHSRLAARGIPVGCETDVYGALSQYAAMCLSGSPSALLDINNAPPKDMAEQLCKTVPGAQRSDFFIGFHCGNTAMPLMEHAALRYKFDRKNPDAPETGTEASRGTLEGRMRDGEITFFRMHADKAGSMISYVQEGSILPVELHTYGCYGTFHVAGMQEFYRNVLIEHAFPHHCAVAYGRYKEQFLALCQFFNIKNM